MSLVRGSAVLAFCILTSLITSVRGDGKKPEGNKPYDGPACSRPADDYFTTEVWGKVAGAMCVQCHKVGGDAEDSRLILKDLRKLQGPSRDEGLRHNREAFARLARVKDGDQS